MRKNRALILAWVFLAGLSGCGTARSVSKESAECLQRCAELDVLRGQA